MSCVYNILSSPHLVLNSQFCELQVICWVLGEYGTADGKYSASYITGKISDIAEAHSTDDMVKVCEVQLLLYISCEVPASSMTYFCIMIHLILKS